MPVCALAVEGAPKPEIAADPLGPGSVVRMVGGLILVVALIFGLGWGARRFGRFGLQSGSALRVVSALSMGARERIVLIQAGDTQILVGVAPGRVQTLHVLDQPVAAQPDDAERERFADRLRQAMSRGSHP